MYISLYSMSTICNSYVFENKKVSLQVSMENVQLNSSTSKSDQNLISP